MPLSVSRSRLPTPSLAPPPMWRPLVVILPVLGEAHDKKHAYVPGIDKFCFCSCICRCWFSFNWVRQYELGKTLNNVLKLWADKQVCNSNAHRAANWGCVIGWLTTNQRLQRDIGHSPHEWSITRLIEYKSTREHLLFGFFSLQCPCTMHLLFSIPTYL